jgi:hypothetical protein
MEDDPSQGLLISDQVTNNALSARQDSLKKKQKSRTKDSMMQAANFDQEQNPLLPA